MNTAAAVVAFFVDAGLPVVGAVCVTRRKPKTIFAFVAGALGFFISQPVLRMTILQRSVGLSALAYTNITAYFFLLGLTAGIFEETARLVGFKILGKNHLTWMDGVAFGLGHGGCEAAWLFVTQVIPLALKGQAGVGVLIGSWERLFTMMVQTGLTFLVLYAVKEKKPQYYLLSVAIHTAIDFILILGNVWILEALITVEGMVALLLVLRLKKRMKE